jgi:Ca2+-binding RTX toxin-like protein
VPPDVKIESGPSGLTNNPSPFFTFSASAGATLSCAIEAETEEAEGPSFAGCAGPSFDTPEDPLPDGPYTFRVRAADAAGNLSDDARSFTVDATPPQTTITSNPAEATDDAKPGFSFASSERGSSFRCRFDSQPFGPCSGPGASDTPSAALADGAHTFEVRATDRAGNTDPTPAEFAFTVITGGPQTRIDAGPAGAVADANPSFQYSADEPASFECKLDGAGFAPCPTGTLQLSNLPEGEHRFEVRARNAVGVADPTPAQRSFIVDLTPPSLPIPSGPLRDPNRPGLTLHLEVKDGNASSPATIRSGVGAIRVRVDGQVVQGARAECKLHVCPPTFVRDLQLPYQKVIGTHHLVLEGEDGVGHFSPLAEWDKTTRQGDIVYLSNPTGTPNCLKHPSTKEVRHIGKRLLGGPHSDLLIAGPGVEEIKGFGGCDVIIGGFGEDKISGGPGEDLIRGKRSDDEIKGGPGNDLIYGGAGDDELLGEGDNDLLDGGPGADTEKGEGGNDTLRGGQGEDHLTGGKGGTDTLSFSDALTPGAADLAFPTYIGFPGLESGVHVDLKGLEPTADDGSPGDGGGVDELYLKKHKKIVETGDFERIIGSPFADLIEGTGTEVIDGGPGPDVILGAAGDDETQSAKEEDFFQGESTKAIPPRDENKIELGLQSSGPQGAEADLYLIGSGGDDHVQVAYHSGANTVSFTALKDGAVNAQAMAERFSVADPACNKGVTVNCCTKGATVNCKLGKGKLGAVVLYGGKGNDKLENADGSLEEPGAFELDGGPDSDILEGGSLEELLVDGIGKAEPAEQLRGGGGDDVLIQGEGPDIVEGGPDNDLLVSANACEGDSIIGGIKGKGQPGADNAQFHPEKAFGIYANLQKNALGEADNVPDPRKPLNDEPQCSDGSHDTLTGINTLEASDQADILVGDESPNLLIGRGGPDYMFGLGGFDKLSAKDGKADSVINCGPSEQGSKGGVAFFDKPDLGAGGIKTCKTNPHGSVRSDNRASLLIPEEAGPPPPILGPGALPPAREPIATYYPLDDRAGTSAESGLQEGIPATYEAAGIGPASNGPGPLLGIPGALLEEEEGSAVKLNGTTDYINLNGQGSLGEDEASGYSVLMFVKFTRPPGQREYLFSSAEGSEGVFLYREADGKLVFASGSDPGSPQVSTSEPIADEKWHLVAGSLQGETISLNIDGFPYRLGYGRSVFPAQSESTQTLIGAGAGISDFLAGEVDEFLTYEGAVTESEIFAQMGESVAEEPELLLLPEPETADADSDGIPDGEDNCPQTANPDQEDADLNGIGDACEPPDGDGDGVSDVSDNCPATFNPDQADANGDGLGDACVGLPPVVATEGTSALTGTSATLKATVNPNGTATTYQFEYGTTETYGTSVPVPGRAIGSGAEAVAVNEAIAGLEPDTTYHYRVLASNEGGETEGADQTFTTEKLPSAVTEAASAVGLTSATLTGTVNPEGLPTEFQFEYGTSVAYGNAVPISGVPVGEGSAPVPFSVGVGGLRVGTTYHYRLRAASPAGSAFGEDRTFKTLLPPGISGQLTAMAVTEPFDGSPASLADFAVNFQALGWASGTVPEGEVSATGWQPADPFPTLNGAFYVPTLSNSGSGLATVATLAREPGTDGGHFSLWLDIPSPQGARAGYELRFTREGQGTYEVTLSRWQAGAQSVLASRSGFALAEGDSLALVDLGSTVSAWTDTGPGFAEVLSVTDASFDGGNAGMEGSDSGARLVDFKFGALPPAPKPPAVLATSLPTLAPTGAPPAKRPRCSKPSRHGPQHPAGEPQLGPSHEPAAHPPCGRPNRRHHHRRGGHSRR